MNIIVCDDIRDDADTLVKIISDSGFEVNTVVFTRSADALRHIRAGAVVDACFLDIHMPEMSGLELASALRADGFAGAIVFLTAANKYAAESYQVKAFSYLVKPATPEMIHAVLRELIATHRKSDSAGILVRMVGGAGFILFRELSHIEVIRHIVCFRLTDGSQLESRTTFAEVAPRLLADSRFIRCHRSYIVNLDDIKNIRGACFIMRTDAKIPISRSFPDAKRRYLEARMPRINAD